MISDIWLKSYNTIANCNVLLERLKKQSPTFFPEGEYDLIYGEVLALRAFLHFDLLRAFAPSWNVDKEALCLPYADNFGDKYTVRRKSLRLSGR
ncbi:MAG: RagB/SusD family nutrient uptake outer membrane protein [Odoribacter splanchnicus]